MRSLNIIFLVVFYQFLLSCNKSRHEIKPTVQDITESVYASGIVKSKNQYQVFSTVAGIIKEVLVREGDTVGVGTPLIKIFNRTSMLQERNAALTAEYSEFSANRQKLEELALSIDVARNKMINDSVLVERQKNLWSQNIGSKIELEQRELNYQNSLSNYRALRLQHHDLERQLKLNAQQARNNLEISNTVTNDYTIRSEVDGRVYDIFKEKGELVSSQTPIALVGDDKDFILELQVDEYDIARIRETQKAFISMDSYKEKAFEAVITKINPVMNERTKSFTVEAEFVTSPPTLYPFLTVEANILIQTKRNAVTIPRPYLADESTVILHGNKRKKVVTGLQDYERVEIVQGLSPDDIIIMPEN